MSNQSDINREFANTFTTLSARIEVFQTTQRTFLENYYDDIERMVPDLSSDEIDATTAIYGICLTDDALKSYSINQFAEDITYLKSLIHEKEKVIVEKPKDNLPTHNLPPKRKETLVDRVKLAISSESEFIKVLTAYYHSNSIIEKVINNFNNELILLHVNDRAELVITSLLIRNHLLPLYHKITGIYESANIDVDLRFVTAQIQVTIERLLNPKSEIDSKSKTFESIVKIYPLGSGDDLYWDLSEQILYSRYYIKLKNLLQPQIDEAREEKLLSRETMMKKMEQTKMQGAGGPTKESIRSKVDSLIFETFQFNRTFDDTARSRMASAVESVLKRMALAEYGVQDIPNIEKFKEYFSEEFFIPIWNEYPQLYLPFIDIREYREFVNDPLGTAEKQKEYILNQFWFKIRKHTKTEKPNPGQLSHAFSMVMYDILNNPKVINFE